MSTMSNTATLSMHSAQPGVPNAGPDHVIAVDGADALAAWVRFYRDMGYGNEYGHATLWSLTLPTGEKWWCERNGERPHASA
jgi:hypothetical protein